MYVYCVYVLCTLYTIQCILHMASGTGVVCFVLAPLPVQLEYTLEVHVAACTVWWWYCGIPTELPLSQHPNSVTTPLNAVCMSNGTRNPETTSYANTLTVICNSLTGTIETCFVG